MIVFLNWARNYFSYYLYLLLFLLGFSYVILHHVLVVSPHYRTLTSITGNFVILAKSMASCIMFCLFGLFLTMCRVLNTKLGQIPIIRLIAPLDNAILYHLYLSWLLVIFSIIHVCAHYINYQSLANATLKSERWYALISGPGFTGKLANILLFLLVTSTSNRIKKANFEVFFYTHHLFIFFLCVLVLHGSFCFVKLDTKPLCSKRELWALVASSSTLYCLEKIYREINGRKKTSITKVIQHPGNVIEAQFSKSNKMVTGQYIWINCPEISVFQWHPFTLTSCPHEKFLSVHMAIRGDWTKKFAEICNRKLPRVMLDGPHGAGFQNWKSYFVLLCIAGGIGATPFASILKEVKYTEPNIKIYLVWSCSKTHSFKWFMSLIQSVKKKHLVPYIYLTQKMKLDQVFNLTMNNSKFDAITGLEQHTNYGRPQFEKIFELIRKKHQGDVGVFYCGPESMSFDVRQFCNKFSTTSTKFEFTKGHF